MRKICEDLAKNREIQGKIRFFRPQNDSMSAQNLESLRSFQYFTKILEQGIEYSETVNSERKNSECYFENSETCLAIGLCPTLSIPFVSVR